MAGPTTANMLSTATVRGSKGISPSYPISKLRIPQPIARGAPEAGGGRHLQAWRSLIALKV